MQEQRKYAVIYNPVAGGRNSQRVASFVSGLLNSGRAVDVYRTERAADAERIVERLCTSTQSRVGYSAVVAAGGDGTVNEVVNGLMKAQEVETVVPPLALLPIGTTNVLAKELDIPETIQGATRTLLKDSARHIRLGQVNGRYFTTMAGIGLDARVVQNVNLDLKRAIRKGAYGLELVKQIAKLNGAKYRIHIGGRSFEAASVVIAKGRYYAGRYSCAPGASVEDGFLHVCMFEGEGRLNAIRYVLGLATGRLPLQAGYNIAKAESVVVTGQLDEPVQADGDLVSALPAHISVAKRSLRGLV
jgi:YegS/Rv2252/BmrU family lipid kinase